MESQNERRKISRVAYDIGIIGDKHIIHLKRTRIKRKQKEKRNLASFSVFVTFLVVALLVNNKQEHNEN